ncbi:MAG: hypothetical protein ACLQQ4_15760 [Bacteroidia bacterium]
MKKLSILLAAMVLFIGISFANPSLNKFQEQPKTDKKDTKKDNKKEVKKVPSKKKADNKDHKTDKK